MMNFLKRTSGVVAIAFLITTQLISAEFYPNRPPTRTLGTDQGLVGDCSSEADITALENAFRTRGFNVRFSLFYRHAKTYVGAPAEKHAEVSLAMNAADNAFVEKAGEVIPEYMWPEDAEGYDPRATNVRPHVSDIAIWDEEMPHTSAFGLSYVFRSFKPNFSNSAPWSELKAVIERGDGVSLSLHEYLLPTNVSRFYWNRSTGLLTSPYNWETLMAAYKAKGKPQDELSVDHRVTVVGFDDSLYPNQSPPGAFIIRNSWNDWAEVRALDQIPNEQEKGELKKMRLKLSPMNLPGYYAVPYQYVIELATHQWSGFNYWTGNYAAYAQKYEQLAERYQIVHAPYACDLENYYRSPFEEAKKKLSNYAKHLKTTQEPGTSKEEKNLAAFRLYQLALQEAGDHHIPREGTVFQYARLNRHAGKKIDRVAEFYEGKFTDYYCVRRTDLEKTFPGNVWPPASFYQKEEFRDALNGMTAPTMPLVKWERFLRTLIRVEAQISEEKWNVAKE